MICKQTQKKGNSKRTGKSQRQQQTRQEVRAIYKNTVANKGEKGRIREEAKEINRIFCARFASMKIEMANGKKGRRGGDNVRQ